MATRAEKAAAQQMRAELIVHCSVCSVAFHPYRPWQKFCGRLCNGRAYNADHRDTIRVSAKKNRLARPADVNKGYHVRCRIKRRLAYPWVELVNGAKGRSKAAGLEFDLTHGWGESRWTGRCELTNIPFVLGKKGHSGGLYSPSIDRITPKIGYTQSNCRFILCSINCFKGAGTDQEIMLIAAALAASVDPRFALAA